MDLREAINKLLLENHKHEYGCVMLYFDFPEMEEIHKLISKEDIYEDEEDPSYGLETYPHCTLLFGLHEEVTTPEVEEVLKNYTFSPLKLYNPSFFEKEDLYDVLKFDVQGDNLSKINKELKNFPYTNDYPNYHPHCTIAYVKPGLGQKYVDLLNKNKLNEYELTPEYVMYSKSDGTQEEIKINIE